MAFNHRYLSVLPMTVALLVAGCAQEPPDGHTVDGLAHPESVAKADDGETFYAANIGEKLAPSEKDGDGSIARLSADGSVENAQYLPSSSDKATLHAPKGTVVIDDRLYTADIDRVVGFNLENRTKIAEISLKEQGVTFLNDITVMNDETLFASGSDQGEVYRIDLDEETVTTLDVDIPGANGLKYAPSDGSLYAVSFGGKQGGQLWTLPLNENGQIEDTSTRTLVEGGRFDGVVLGPNGHILISDWGVEGASNPTAALHRVADHGTGEVTTIELRDWQGPADFTCANDRGCWIPDLPASVVTVVRPDERL